jgi:hypothetical protein
MAAGITRRPLTVADLLMATQAAAAAEPEGGQLASKTPTTSTPVLS